MALQIHSHEWGVAVLVTSTEVDVCHGCALFMVFVMVTSLSELLEDFDFKPKGQQLFFLLKRKVYISIGKLLNLS